MKISSETKFKMKIVTIAWVAAIVLGVAAFRVEKYFPKFHGFKNKAQERKVQSHAIPKDCKRGIVSIIEYGEVNVQIINPENGNNSCLFHFLDTFPGSNGEAFAVTLENVWGFELRERIYSCFEKGDTVYFDGHPGSWEIYAVNGQNIYDWLDEKLRAMGR